MCFAFGIDGRRDIRLPHAGTLEFPLKGLESTAMECMTASVTIDKRAIA